MPTLHSTPTGFDFLICLPIGFRTPNECTVTIKPLGYLKNRGEQGRYAWLSYALRR